jgi:hypothetical protein
VQLHALPSNEESWRPRGKEEDTGDVIFHTSSDSSLLLPLLLLLLLGIL